MSKAAASTYQAIPMEEVGMPAPAAAPAWYDVKKKLEQDERLHVPLPSARRCFGLLDPLEAVALGQKLPTGMGYEISNLFSKQVMYEDFSAYASVLTTLVWVAQNELVTYYDGATPLTDGLLWSILLLTLLTVTFVFESVLAIFEIKTIRCPELKKLTLWQGPIVCKK